MDGRDGTGEIEGSTRGPRGPKKLSLNWCEKLSTLTYLCRRLATVGKDDLSKCRQSGAGPKRESIISQISKGMADIIPEISLLHHSWDY